MAAKSITTIRQVLSYQPQQTAWFAATQALFNQVVAFYFEVIQAHEKLLDLTNKEALTALEMLTHTTRKNPTPAMPLEEIRGDLPRCFGEPRSMPLLDQLAPSSPTSTSGGNAKRRP